MKKRDVGKLGMDEGEGRDLPQNGTQAAKALRGEDDPIYISCDLRLNHVHVQWNCASIQKLTVYVLSI